MNDKPKEKVYAERLDSSKKIGKRLRKKQSKTTKKKTLKQKKTKNSNLRKRGFTLTFSFKCQMKNKRVVTKILSSPVFYQK
ncbi:hypothetical protein L3X09_06395 [Enterococcus faecium]|nr:hypothetical protein [Enterococcus faecium]